MSAVDYPTVISRIGVSLCTQLKAEVLDYDCATFSLLMPLDSWVMKIYSQEAGRLRD